MRLDDFDYHLPPELIAQHPLAERDASRMMLLSRTGGTWEHRSFREFPDVLRGDELLVVNNTRVIPARLYGRRKGIHAQPLGKNSAIQKENLSAEIEVLLLRARGPQEWDALVRPGRKIPVGEAIIFGNGELQAEVIAREEFGVRRLRFSGPEDLLPQIERLGHIPLPPYIKREDSPEDRRRYQTIFARAGAAVAAPTAGLHFTPAVLERLRARGIEMAEITLDVGLGTFEPIHTETIEEHKIHGESYEIPAATAEAIARAQAANRPILAVGTTVVRALEDSAEKNAEKISAASHAGEKNAGTVSPGRAEADIFLFPGKPFRIVNQLLTNFHLPRSSLVAMVSAFAGRENVLRAYAAAVQAKYRFYSYGDCMLIR